MHPVPTVQRSPLSSPHDARKLSKPKQQPPYATQCNKGETPRERDRQAYIPTLSFFSLEKAHSSPSISRVGKLGVQRWKKQRTEAELTTIRTTYVPPGRSSTKARLVHTWIRANFGPVFGSFYPDHKKPQNAKTCLISHQWRSRRSYFLRAPNPSSDGFSASQAIALRCIYIALLASHSFSRPCGGWVRQPTLFDAPSLIYNFSCLGVAEKVRKKRLTGLP